MAGRPSIQLDTAVMKNMYDDGVKLAVIARYFGVSTNKVRKTRDSLSLPKRLNTVIVDENEFIRLFEARVTYVEMARQLGMSRCSVIVIKNRLNIPNRNNLCKKVQNER
jgi:hypothetical protein